MMYVLIFLLFITSVQSAEFVKHYTSWCGHCKKLKPVWDELSDKYRDDKRVNILSINCDENKGSCKNVRGYPTLILYKDDGSHETYHGNRNLDDLSRFLEEFL